MVPQTVRLAGPHVARLVIIPYNAETQLLELCCYVAEPGVLRINSIARSDAGVSLSWSAQPGKNYRVQFTDDLRQALWTALSGDVTATEPVATKLDPGALSAFKRFYRVLELP